MLNVEDWAEIRRLHRAEGMAIRAIARRLKVSKNTVKKALASHEPPRYQRKPRGSAVDEFEPQIRALLAEFPDMPTTVIMERVGWQRGRTVFFDRVAQLRPLFKPVDPASRTEYQPGELAQCDLWFPPVDVPLGFGHVGRPPVLVMVTGYSRVTAATMIPTRQSPDLLAGHWKLICGWGRVPRTLVWDNESAVGQWRGGKPQLTEPMNAFRGSLGIKVVQCRPGDPEAKGLVERANGYLETSFLPGRTFTSPADFNFQLTEWLVKANQRHHRRLGCRPIDRWQADRAAMLELPPVDPVVGWRFSTRLPRDHYVRLDSNDYSVHPAAIGRRGEVRADLEQVVITLAGAELARHQRCWADHQTITDPDHAAAAADLRRARRLVAVPAIDTDVEHRNLSDYDRMFDLDEASSSEEIA
ncbi:IS21 family transposase [Nocardia farcinica]|uniref:IS21 family transposase n=1 Tax=Nocardia farcinica TaxID=37329 RepID=UPI0018931D5E|nr:IS21 family transposase [Nocardia farcinica]MBF6271703.1 IS21 family transposase [Nocardia farcinica]MCZ9330424.1 IS21 family transposase [Nocardia farcinica]